jgi:hypothetical protein
VEWFVECFESGEGENGKWLKYFEAKTARGDEETWQAGLRVRKGVKVGLNIWSWGVDASQRSVLLSRVNCSKMKTALND